MATESAKSANKRERTCVGCGEKAAPNAMVRLVLGPDGDVAVDAAGGAFGRGAHVHPAHECVVKACKFGLARSFKTRIEITEGELGAEIAAAYLRRAEGLLLAAKRARRLAQGADETYKALASDPNAVVVVANDAASVVNRTEIASAIKEGRACVWTNKSTLGRMLGREEVAVCAVTDVAIAEALRHAVGVAGSVRVIDKSPIEDVKTCLEDR